MSDTVKVLRGSAIIANGNTTLTLTNGVDYTLEDTDDTKWFFRITNSNFTGMGITSGGGNQSVDDFTVVPVQSGANTVLTRAGSSNDCRVDWEIVQYTGTTSDNEFIVREKGVLTLANGVATSTPALPSGILNNDDVVIWITGQAGSDTGRNAPHSALFTAEMGSTTWTATRGNTTNNGYLAYAIVEYTGSDYTVNSESFTVASVETTHALTTAVSDVTKTFIHAQNRYDTSLTAGINDASVRVYLSSTTALSVRNETSDELTLKEHVVYLVENPNLTVQRVAAEMAGTGEEETETVSITQVADTELTSLTGLTSTSTGGGTALPRGYINFTLSSDSSVLLRQSDDGQTSQYSFEVVEWPAGGGGGGSTVSPSGIGSEEAFGSPTLAAGAALVFPQGVASEETLGSPSIVLGSVTLGATAIPSAEAFGSPSLLAGASSVQPSAIPTGEALGSPNIDVGTVLIEPVSIVSEEVFGTPQVTIALTAIAPTGIISAEAFGACLVKNLVSLISLSGIPTEEVFGRVIVVGGDRIIIPIDDRQTWNRVANYLRGRSFKGSDNDVIIQWLRSEGYEGQYNDAFDSYLEIDQCYQGTLTDKYAKWKRGETPTGCWLLEGGIWNDNGSWIDTEFWED